MHRCLLLASTICLLVPASSVAQDNGPELPAGFDEPMPIHHDGKGLGPFSRPITTTSHEAQLYFDQGVQLIYAFDPNLGARSFREGWKRDPDCAMCYFGEAWAWGPYLNGPMVAADAPRAHAAIQKALEVMDGHSTEVERALIEAMAQRYAPEHDQDERRKLDEKWADLINDLYETYPTDLDIGFLAGEALMLLQPRRGGWDMHEPAVQRLNAVLESVLAQDITHPGSCHLYIHSTEPSVEPGRAEECANYLGSSIPGASHIQHMPSHTFNRIGRWGDAVRANTDAWHSDLKAEYGDGFAIYPSHNLHMLLFAASNDGQGAAAIQASREYSKLMGGGSFYEALSLFRFGRFDELLQLDDPPDGDVFRGLYDFSKGYAHLRTGDAGTARFYLHEVQTAAEEDSGGFRGHSAAQLLGVVGAILEGEILRADDELELAIAALEEAVEIEDGFPYSEPEPLGFSVRHWLGDALWEAERHEEAVEVFRAELLDHPHNGWSLFGLQRSLRALGLQQEADVVQEEFLQAWARSDTYIRSPIF